MSESIRIRARWRDGATDVQLLMPHPMETGLRSDDTGRLVPVHHITDVTVAVAGRAVLVAQFGMAVSRDPLIAFRCTAARPGDRVSVTWLDSRGEQRSGETLVA